MTALFVGVDVAKSTLEACKFVAGRFHHRKFPNLPYGFQSLVDWLTLASESQDIFLAVESTGRCHLALVEFAHACDLNVFVLNPARLKHYAQSQPRRAKTDREDAKLITMYLSKHHEQLHRFKPARQEVLALRELVRRRDQLIKMLKQEGNRLSALDEAHVLYSSHQKLIDLLNEEKNDIDARIDTLMAQDAELQSSFKLLKSVPQVGRVLAMTILAEMSEGKTFEKAKEVTAWLGLAPMAHQSGTSVNYSARTSYGNTRMRNALFMSAMGALRSKTWDRWLEPHRQRGKSGKVLIIALMDKLARVCWGILKSKRPFDPNLVFPA